MSDIALFTGGFDPLHSGHIQTINEARQYGPVVIGLNSDDWLTRKKGKPFMPFEERRAILKEIKGVLDVIAFDDHDNSACDAIRRTKAIFPTGKVTFVNGGDRTAENIPEVLAFRDDNRVEFRFGVGGDYKKNSSSWLLQDWVAQTEKRKWGSYFVHYAGTHAKVKRLVLDPHQSISMQYHNHRSELWFVEEGCGALFSLADKKEIQIATLEQFQFCTVPVGKWHRLENVGDTPLTVLEIQYGEHCSESDIVRLTAP